MKFVSQSPEDTQKIAAKLAEQFLARMSGRSGALVVALEGELGAGKTTFVQGFAKVLGITEQPKSPTFNLVKQYPVPGTPHILWHVDCYRLTGHTDLAALDLHTAFANPHNIMLVEWAQNIADALPTDTIVIRFDHADGDKRKITVNTDPDQS